MKKIIMIVLAAVLILSFAGCDAEDIGDGYADVNGDITEFDGDDPGEPVSTDPEPSDGFLRRMGYEIAYDGVTALGIVRCEEQDFSTLVSFPFICEWADDDGLYMHLKRNGQNMPYLLIYRNEGIEGDPAAYLEGQYIPEMEEAYGSDLLETGEIGPYGDSGLYSVRLRYNVPGEDREITCQRVCGMIGDSFVIFTAKKESADNDAIFTYLKEVTKYYRNGADVYSEGDQVADMVSELPATQKDAGAGFGEYTVSDYSPLLLSTVQVSNDIFTMEVPEGWQMTTRGNFTDFGIYIYDPVVPERKIFFYSKAEWFNKTQAEKDRYAQLAAMVDPGNDPYMYNASAEVPALDPPTTANFYSWYDAFVQVIYRYEGTGHIFPDLHDLQVIEEFPSQTPSTSACLDNSIVRATFTSDSGTLCQGLMGGQVTDKMTMWDSGIDMGFYSVYDMMGITAPEGEFADLEPVLLRCLTSFDFTPSYVSQSVSNANQETEAILAQARSMQAAYDSYNSAWNSRQSDYDIISQKNSDATLGYDRLYDPDTNEVYRAETGFYDEYDLNRDSYSNPNLQIIDSSSEQYYLNPIDHYITR